MLVDVSTVDTRTTVLGTPISMPLMVAPTAFHGLAHPEGECETARGVGKSHTLMVAGTSATRTLEEIASSASGPLWFQLYIADRVSAARLVRSATVAGYRALVVTVDAPVWGNKERPVRQHFALPAHLRKANFTEEEDGTNNDPTVTWETLAWLRSLTSLPLVLKGILTVEDALLAVKHGVEGIVISNHGGRQLDGVEAPIEVLPEIVEAVAGRCEIYVDGGIRRGTDIVKALALGARAVLVGRPALWGLAYNGSEGVHEVLELLRAEFERTMKLVGRPTLASIDRSLVKLP
jgi:isopentenyl diphosphate isomerase/L-lactate dehydrogenase-like FMN-dependent dehydrogenase